jgi:hypothetical protein
MFTSNKSNKPGLFSRGVSARLLVSVMSVLVVSLLSNCTNTVDEQPAASSVYLPAETETTTQTTRTDTTVNTVPVDSKTTTTATQTDITVVDRTASTRTDQRTITTEVLYDSHGNPIFNRKPKDRRRVLTGYLDVVFSTTYEDLDEIVQVNVVLSKIEVYSDSGKWVSVADYGAHGLFVNLASLQNDPLLLPRAVLNAGEYSKIRLVMDDTMNQVVKMDDEKEYDHDDKGHDEKGNDDAGDEVEIKTYPLVTPEGYLPILQYDVAFSVVGRGVTTLQATLNLDDSLMKYKKYLKETWDQKTDSEDSEDSELAEEAEDHSDQKYRSEQDDEDDEKFAGFSDLDKELKKAYVIIPSGSAQIIEPDSL